MALKPGDVLVLTTDTSYGSVVMDDPDAYPVALFYIETIEHNPRFTWSMVATGRIIKGDGSDCQLHEFLYLEANPFPKILHKKRGLCTSFTFDVRHGYRLHFLNFVRNRLPQIYQKINFG